jgi:hypothetical protein
MRTLAQAELLALWETGRSLEPLDRGVLAACAVSPELGNAADWPLGERNRALARLHCAAFGGVLRGWTKCLECEEKLEFAFDGHSVAEAESEVPEAEQSRQMVTVGKWLFRLPTSRDLAIASAVKNEQEAMRRLLNSCCADAEPVTEWSDEEVEVIETRLAEADPMADILLHFDCPSCSASFDESLDLGEFVWAEIERQANRILRDVHVLASAYGWSEGEILALSPARRSAYLEMVLA